MAPKNPPSQIYNGVAEAGLDCRTDEVFTPRFNTSKQIKPTKKLSKEPINGPPVSLPNLVFNIACIGSSPPTASVININKYFIRKNLAVSQFVKLHKSD
jgi:hypothetical protein